MDLPHSMETEADAAGVAPEHVASLEPHVFYYTKLPFIGPTSHVRVVVLFIVASLRP